MSSKENHPTRREAAGVIICFVFARIPGEFLCWFNFLFLPVALDNQLAVLMPPVDKRIIQNVAAKST